MFYGGLAAMTFSMSADESARLSNMSVSGTIEGKIGGIKDMGVLSLKATGSMDDTNTKDLENYSTTFGMVLMPAAVELALTTTLKQKAGAANVTTAAIDCNAWTKRLQAVYDTDRWMTPVMYGFANTPGLLQFADAFLEGSQKCGTTVPDAQERLGRIQADLQKFMDTCQYANPSSYSMTDGSTVNYCPKSRNTNCVFGRQETGPAKLKVASSAAKRGCILKHALPNSDLNPTAQLDAGSYRPQPPNNAACVSCFKSSTSPANGPNVRYMLILDCAAACCS